MATLEDIKARCARNNYEDDDECWEWRFYAQDGKDPQMVLRGPWAKGLYKTFPVRRVAYELAIGTIAPKRWIVQKCENPLCVNPKHLAAKSKQQVLKAAAKRGCFKNPTRCLKSAQTLRAKSRIDEEGLREIRSTTGRTKEYSERFGVSEAYIRMLRNHQRRKDVATPFSGIFSGLLRPQLEPA